MPSELNTSNFEDFLDNLVFELQAEAQKKPFATAAEAVVTLMLR